jgi:hypothetical protein
MNAFFGRTGGAEFPDHLKVMISGPPKSGKTSFLGTVPNIVIADTEPHANNLQSIAHLNLPFRTIASSQDLDTLALILSDTSMRKQAAQALGLPDIEAVAIDTLDTLQKLLKRERMKEQRQTKFLRDDWGWLKEEMTSIIQKFTALPVHVFFIVHTKTQSVGSDEEGRTVILPGLEGAIAQEIAGMVGYSLMAFRRQGLQPDGTTKTEYFLRAEGDETYEFLGNRAAGRLPDIIEPSFATLQHYASLARNEALAEVKQHQDELVAASIAQPPVPAPAETVVQNPVQQAPATPAVQTPVQSVPPAVQQPVAAPAPAAAPKAADDEPVNAAALSHIKKVFDALKAAFPEQHILDTKNLGEARTLVKMWVAVQEDHVRGTGTGASPEAEIREFMEQNGWFPAAGEVTQEAPAVIVPDLHGTIEQILAYVGDDLAKVQEAYDIEVAKDKPRSSLVDRLTSKGAAHTAPAPVEAAADVQTSVQTEAPVEAPAEVIPEPVAVEAAPTEEQAIETVKEVLGGEVTSQADADTGPCEQCGKNPVDDIDIARLSRTRFGKWLCVTDYIQATKSA